MTSRRIQHRVVLWARLRRDSGQALIETAVSVSFMVLLMLGAVEFGYVAYASIEVSNAARAGVQYAAMNGGAIQDYTGIQNAAAADAKEIAALSGTNFFIVRPVPVSCVCADGTNPGDSTCMAPTDCTSSHLITSVTVKTQATFPLFLHMPGFGSTFTLYGQAVEKVLQ